MFNAIAQPSHGSTLFRIKLIGNNETIGIITISQYPNSNYSAILHLYIKLKYRKKWLTSKYFGSKIFTILVTVSKDKNIKFIYSAALKPESERLLHYFHFDHYTNNIYRLDIKRFL